MFERFTDRARRVLVLAQQEAARLNHGFLGTEHLLLGLISEGEGVAAKALRDLDISLDAARHEVEEMVGLSALPPNGSPPFTPRAKKVLELALREAMQLGNNYIGTEHLLLGLVREGDGIAAQVLVALGADLPTVRQTVIQLLSGYRGEGSTDAPNVKTARLVRCSFCGRRPPDSGRLVQGRSAFICEHCVVEWGQRLAGGDGDQVEGPIAKLYDPEELPDQEDKPEDGGDR